MKKKIFIIMPLIITILLSLTICSNAAYKSNDPSVESEGNITITVTSTEALTNYDISLEEYKGLTYISCSSSNTGAAVNSSQGKISFATLGDGVTTLGTFNFKAPKVTTTTTYQVKFDVDGTTNISTVTVKAPETQPSNNEENNNNNENNNTENNNTENNNTNNEPATQEPEQKEEPNFVDTNKTMYVESSSVRLRKKWDTTKDAVEVTKGTELNIVATSDNKVDGHIWYKVNYQGSTKYVASELLTATKPEEEEKSDNAKLKSLSIEGYELKPSFKASTLSYTLEVGNDVNELKITAEAEDSKAKVDIEGNKDFKEGENKVSVKVTAEDGTEKVYELSVTKSKGVVLGLKVLKIKDTDMETKFKTDVFSYKINVDNVDKLEIEAIPTIDKATVEILGNENLQDGENTITIIVKSEDGKETKTYQIIANKNVAIATEENKTDNNVKLDGRVYLYGGICILAFILLVILIVVLIRNKSKNKHDDDPDNGDLYDYDKHADKYDKFKNEFSDDFNKTSGGLYGLDDKKYEDIPQEEEYTPVEDKYEEKDEQIEKTETYYKEDQYSPDEEAEEYNSIKDNYEENGFTEDEYKDSVMEKNEYDEQTQEELERDIEKQFGSLYNNTEEDEEEQKPRRGRGKHF